MQNILIWTALIILSGLTLAITSRGAENSGRRKALIPAVLVILSMGYFLGWGVSEGNLAAAFSAFVMGAVLLNIYYRELEKRGYVLGDERTLRIEETASRRTLQATMLFLAVLMVYLSVEKTTNSELDLAFKTVSGILVFVFITHWTLFHYYSRVM
ncbi:hypothetical protein A3L09_07600 [Thermococcus profundus]|uniref:DUF2178 domain-containing protein n=2 Tax=Thermococcus profundus TaxID=49899 RepID=A0A2Z2MBF7_THEPR|nr:hypothetical protein A3L09_07600 [Thermococcus profundus]